MTTRIANDVLSMLLDSRPTGDRRFVEVAQVWGDALLDVKRPPIPRVTIGGARRRGWMSASPACDLLVPALGDGAFELVRPGDPDPVVQLEPSWTGFALVGAEERELVAWPEDGGLRRIPLLPDVRVVVEVGGMTLLVQRVAPGRAVAAPIVDRVDWGFTAVASATAVCGLLMSALIFSAPADANAAMLEEPDRDVQTQLLVLPKVEKPVANAGGEKAKGAEGAARPGKTRGHGAPKRDVTDAGVLAALRDGAFDSALGSDALAGALDATATIGSHPTASIGGTGLGDRGPGFGGGGHADTIGDIGLHGPGHGPGDGGGTWGQKPHGDPPAIAGDPIVMGGIDRALVDEVVKRHMSQIRYCYQRQLQKESSLAGKVVVKFTIAADGSVSSAGVKSSSLGSAAVESCIVDRFDRMTFPPLKGGGMAVITYPFLFSGQ